MHCEPAGRQNRRVNWKALRGTANRDSGTIQPLFFSSPALPTWLKFLETGSERGGPLQNAGIMGG